MGCADCKRVERRMAADPEMYRGERALCSLHRLQESCRQQRDLSRAEEQQERQRRIQLEHDLAALSSLVEECRFPGLERQGDLTDYAYLHMAITFGAALQAKVEEPRCETIRALREELSVLREVNRDLHRRLRQ